MIEVTVSNPHQYPVADQAVEEAVSRVFLAYGITVAEVGVELCDEERMRFLNEQYKHHVGVTDVLTFVMHDPEQPTPTFLESADTRRQYGDIVLCVPVVEQEAREEGIPLVDKAVFLIEHGALHLAGIHHE